MESHSKQQRAINYYHMLIMNLQHMLAFFFSFPLKQSPVIMESKSLRAGKAEGLAVQPVQGFPLQAPCEEGVSLPRFVSLKRQGRVHSVSRKRFPLGGVKGSWDLCHLAGPQTKE